MTLFPADAASQSLATNVQNMLETIGISLALLGLVFAFEGPRKRFVRLLRRSGPTVEERAAAAGLDPLELKIVTILSEPHRDFPRTNYLAHRLKTHEYNIRAAAQVLEEKGIVHYCHFSPEDEFGLLLNERGRKFLVEHKLVE